MQHRIRILRVRTIVWLAVLVAIPALPGTAMARSAAPEAGGLTLTPRLLADASWHGRPIQRPFARRSDVSDRGARLRPGAGYRLADGSRRVRDVQRRLIRLGYRPGPSDGLYGPRTQAAVLAFQRKHGLARTGTVGRATLRILQRRTSPQAPRTPRPAGRASQPAPRTPQAPPATPARSTDGGLPALVIVALALLAIPLVLLAGLLLRDRRRVVVKLPVKEIEPRRPDPVREPQALPQARWQPLLSAPRDQPAPVPQARTQPVPDPPPAEAQEPRIRRVPPPRHVASQERRQALRQRILTMRAEGMTLQQIADLLTAEGEVTPGGGRRWQPWTVRAATRPIDPRRGPTPQHRHGQR
jgi:peptidoglycan hydrolase-like protein with peptidoglycan-binding domain